MLLLTTITMYVSPLNTYMNLPCTALGGTTGEHDLTSYLNIHPCLKQQKNLLRHEKRSLKSTFDMILNNFNLSSSNVPRMYTLVYTEEGSSCKHMSRQYYVRSFCVVNSRH